MDLDDVVSSLLKDLDNTEGKRQRLEALAQRIAVLREYDSSDDDDDDYDDQVEEEEEEDITDDDDDNNNNNDDDDDNNTDKDNTTNHNSSLHSQSLQLDDLVHGGTRTGDIDYGKSRVWLPVEEEEESEKKGLTKTTKRTKEVSLSTSMTPTVPKQLSPKHPSHNVGGSSSSKSSDRRQGKSSTSKSSPSSTPSSLSSPRSTEPESSKDGKNTGKISENVKNLLSSLFHSAQDKVQQEDDSDDDDDEHQQEKETIIASTTRRKSNEHETKKVKNKASAQRTYRPHRINNIDSLQSFTVTLVASDVETSSASEDSKSIDNHQKQQQEPSRIQVSDQVRNVLGSLLGDVIRETSQIEQPHVSQTRSGNDHHDNTVNDRSSAKSTPSVQSVKSTTSSKQGRKVTENVKNILGDLLQHAHSNSDQLNDTVVRLSTAIPSKDSPVSSHRNQRPSVVPEESMVTTITATTPSTTKKKPNKERIENITSPQSAWSSSSYSSRSSHHSTPISDLSQTIAALDNSLKDMQNGRDAFELFRQQVLEAIARLTPVPLPVTTTAPTSAAKPIIHGNTESPKESTGKAEPLIPQTPSVIVTSPTTERIVNTPIASKSQLSYSNESVIHDIPTDSSPLGQVQENLLHVMKTLDSIRKGKVTSPPSSTVFRSVVSPTESLSSPLPTRTLYNDGTTPFSPSTTKVLSPNNVTSSYNGQNQSQTFDGNPYTRELMQAFAIAETASQRATAAETAVNELTKRLKEIEQRPVQRQTNTINREQYEQYTDKFSKENIHWKEENHAYVPHEGVVGVHSRDKSPTREQHQHTRSDTPLSSRVGRNIDAPPLPNLYGGGPSFQGNKKFVRKQQSGLDDTLSEEDFSTSKRGLPTRAESLHAALKAAERASTLQEEATQAKLRSVMLEGQIKEQRWAASVQAAQMQGIIKSVSSAMVDLGRVTHIDEKDHKIHRKYRYTVPSVSEGTVRPPYWPNERVNILSEHPKVRSKHVSDDLPQQQLSMQRENNKELIRMLQATLAKTIAAIDPNNPNIQLLQRLPDL